MTIFKDSRHFSRTLGDVWWQSFQDSHHFSRTWVNVWWQSLRTAITSGELWTRFDDSPYSSASYHKVLDFTAVLSTQPAGSDERVAWRHLKSAFYHNFERPTRTKSREGCHSTSPYHKVLDFTTVLSFQPAESDERVARRHERFAFYHNFERSNTHKVTRELQWSAEEFAFYHSFERPTRPKWRKGCSATSKICILPQFWASDTSKVTKGSLGHVKNFRFTTVLSVRHVRSDERVDPRAQKFVFYHSFERPTRPKWRKGRSASSEICILPAVLSVRHARSHERVDRRRQKFAFYLSFERPTRTKWREGCQIHRCDPCAPDRKRIYFNTFSDDFD